MSRETSSPIWKISLRRVGEARPSCAVNRSATRHCRATSTNRQRPLLSRRNSKTCNTTRHAILATELRDGARAQR